LWNATVSYGGRLLLLPGRGAADAGAEIRADRQYLFGPGHRDGAAWDCRLARRQRGLYASTKAAVIMLTKTLARELGPDGVTVNCIAPGTFVTPISYSTRSPEQVQEHLEYRSSYVTGRTLNVGGGRSDRM
jgi:NAD(P)-dependent dehydrogenase (short-subunit alcohol dehydrogenase family)